MNFGRYFACIWMCFFLPLSLAGQGITVVDRAAKTKQKLAEAPWTSPAQFANLQLAYQRNQSALEQAKLAGYLQAELSETHLQNDTLYTYWSLGNRILHARVNLPAGVLYGQPEATTRVIPFTALANQVQLWNTAWQNAGHPLAQTTLRDFRIQNDTLYATLHNQVGEARKIDRLIFQGYSQFSKKHQTYLRRKYTGLPASPQRIEQLQADLAAWSFVALTRPIETLFTTDSTHLYITVEKTKSNRFDGIVGFTNDETQSKVVFSGYLDAELTNLIHRGEQLHIQWKSDGNDQRTFAGKIELPYLFSLPLALQGELNLFQQDSTFQNASSSVGLGYYATPKWKTYLAYRSVSSSDIQNTNSTELQDFDATFVDWKNTYTITQNQWPIFGPRFRLQTQISTGTREGKLQSEKQWIGQSQWEALFPISNRHFLFVSNGLFWLNSETFLSNELERFGGAKTLRGFNENQFRGNQFAWLQSEYRYLVSSSLYVHSIMDFGTYQNKPDQTDGKLWSVGVGAGIQTPMGVLSLLYANGTQDDQPFKFANSLFHFTLRTSF